MDTFLKVAPFGTITIIAALTQLIDIVNNISPSGAYENDKRSAKKFSLIILGCCGLMQLARGDYKTAGTVTFVSGLMQFMNMRDHSEISRWLVVVATGIVTYMD